MDIGEIFGKLKDFVGDVVDYVKNFKTSSLYRFGEMIYAIVMLIVTIVKTVS